MPLYAVVLQLYGTVPKESSKVCTKPKNSLSSYGPPGGVDRWPKVRVGREACWCSRPLHTGSRTVKSTLGSRKFHYLGTSQAHIRWVFGGRFFLVTRWNEVLGACEVALHVEGGCCEVRGRFFFVL